MTPNDAVVHSSHAATLSGQRLVDAGREQVGDVTPAEPKDDRGRRTPADGDTVDGDRLTSTDDQLT